MSSEQYNEISDREIDRRLKIERIKYYSARNREDEQERHEDSFFDVLRTRWGYVVPPPRRRRYW